MEIIEYRLDFKGVPPLRQLDITTKKSAKILVWSPNQELVDISLLHEAHKKVRSGIMHHYIIKNNDQYDGKIYYCRPRMYQNEINPAPTTPLGHAVNNSITICVVGKLSASITSAQRTSLINLATFLLEQENMDIDSFAMKSDVVGGAPDIYGWKGIFDEVKSKLEARDLYRGIAQSGTVNGVRVSSSVDRFVATPQYRSLKVIADIIKVDVSILATMNPHIVNSDSIPVGTSIFMPSTPYSKTVIATQQYYISDATLSVINETVNTSVIESKNYKAAVAAGIETNVFGVDKDITALSTRYGGKDSPRWSAEGIELPGYKNAYFYIAHKSSGESVFLPFLVSPSSFNDTRSNSQQMNKTNAGWFILRTGKNPGSVNLTGYMLDTKHALERHKFLSHYRTYIEDRKNERFEYVNNYTVKLTIEGREYFGYIQSISFSKSAVQQFLYQYSISFVALGDTMVYDSKYALQSATKMTAAIQQIQTQTTPGTILAPSVYAALGEYLNSPIVQA